MLQGKPLLAHEVPLFFSRCKQGKPHSPSRWRKSHESLSRALPYSLQVIKLEKCVDQTLYFRETSLVGGELGDTWQIPCLQKFLHTTQGFRSTDHWQSWVDYNQGHISYSEDWSVCSSWIENFGTAQIKLPCLQQGLRLMSQTQPRLGTDRREVCSWLVAAGAPAAVDSC